MRGRQSRLVIEVHDTGVGIPPEAMTSVFQEFQQLNPQAAEGFGLGLSIVKGKADRLGHRIDAHSRPGIGSCFSVTVPLADPEAARAPSFRRGKTRAGTRQREPRRPSAVDL